MESTTLPQITDVFYYLQPVDDADQARSLAQYLTCHGVFAHPEGADQVLIPLIGGDDAVQTMESFATARQLVGSWRRFWEHTEQGVLDLPIYFKR